MPFVGGRFRRRFIRAGCCGAGGADVPDTVENAGQEQHDDTEKLQEPGKLIRQIKPQEMQKHHRIEQERGKLAVPFRPQDHVRPVEDQQLGGSDEALLHAQNDDEPQKPGEAEHQTAEHGKLGELVGQGIQRLPEFADHVKAAGDKAVQHVGEARGCQQNDGGRDILPPEISPHEDRDQQDPKCRKQIGHRQDLALEKRVHKRKYLSPAKSEKRAWR